MNRQDPRQSHGASRARARQDPSRAICSIGCTMCAPGPNAPTFLWQALGNYPLSWVCFICSTDFFMGETEYSVYISPLFFFALPCCVNNLMFTFSFLLSKINVYATHNVGLSLTFLEHYAIGTVCYLQKHNENTDTRKQKTGYGTVFRRRFPQ